MRKWLLGMAVVACLAVVPAAAADVSFSLIPSHIEAKPGEIVEFQVFAESPEPVEINAYQFSMPCGDGLVYVPDSLFASGDEALACAGHFDFNDFGHCSDEPPTGPRAGSLLFSSGSSCLLSEPVLLGSLSYVVPSDSGTYPLEFEGLNVVIGDGGSDDVIHPELEGAVVVVTEGCPSCETCEEPDVQVQTVTLDELQELLAQIEDDGRTVDSIVVVSH